ncbi:hypothetical protein DBR06_SOUSAS110353, partial [Sousa chinensis]
SQHFFHFFIPQAINKRVQKRGHYGNEDSGYLVKIQGVALTESHIHKDVAPISNGNDGDVGSTGGK